MTWSFVVAVNIANDGGKKDNRQQNGCWEKEIAFYQENVNYHLKFF